MHNTPCVQEIHKHFTVLRNALKAPKKKKPQFFFVTPRFFWWIIKISLKRKNRIQNYRAHKEQSSKTVHNPQNYACYILSKDSTSNNVALLSKSKSSYASQSYPGQHSSNSKCLHNFLRTQKLSRNGVSYLI